MRSAVLERSIIPALSLVSAWSEETMTQDRHDVLREVIAALCHEQWSGWMKYLFSKASPDGRELPQWAVDRWSRQATTSYENLTEEEKDSDRKEADRFLDILRTTEAQAREELAESNQRLAVRTEALENEMKAIEELRHQFEKVRDRAVKAESALSQSREREAGLRKAIQGWFERIAKIGPAISVEWAWKEQQAVRYEMQAVVAPSSPEAEKPKED